MKKLVSLVIILVSVQAFARQPARDYIDSKLPKMIKFSCDAGMADEGFAEKIMVEEKKGTVYAFYYVPNPAKLMAKSIILNKNEDMAKNVIKSLKYLYGSFLVVAANGYVRDAFEKNPKLLTLGVGLVTKDENGKSVSIFVTVFTREAQNAVGFKPKERALEICREDPADFVDNFVVDKYNLYPGTTATPFPGFLIGLPDQIATEHEKLLQGK